MSRRIFNILGWVTAISILEAHTAGHSVVCVCYSLGLESPSTLEDNFLGWCFPDGHAFVFLVESSGLEVEVVSRAACLPALYPREGRSCILLLGGFSLEVPITSGRAPSSLRS